MEQGVILKIEEALKDIESIKKVESTARESVGSVNLTIYEDYDVLTVMDEVKSSIDAVIKLPEQAEKAVIKERVEGSCTQHPTLWESGRTSIKEFTEELKTNSYPGSGYRLRRS